MQSKSLVVLSALCAVASAHFQLQYPAPRGVFVEKDEVVFCDNYPNAVSNRTVFPLSGGTISLNSEHPIWSLGVLLSTSENPQNFQAFNIAVPFFEVFGEGAFCFPVDLAAAGITGVSDGTNVTIQLEFNGGDDVLYQCADLTLSSNATIPSSVSCTNATGDTVSTLPSSETQAPPTPSGSNASASATGSTTGSSSGAPAATSASGAATMQSAMGISGLLGLAGLVLAFF